jgi:hypothetical protein
VKGENSIAALSRRRIPSDHGLFQHPQALSLTDREVRPPVGNYRSPPGER